MSGSSYKGPAVLLRSRSHSYGLVVLVLFVSALFERRPVQVEHRGDRRHLHQEEEKIAQLPSDLHLADYLLIVAEAQTDHHAEDVDAD